MQVSVGMSVSGRMGRDADDAPREEEKGGELHDCCPKKQVLAEDSDRGL